MSHWGREIWPTAEKVEFIKEIYHREQKNAVYGNLKEKDVDAVIQALKEDPLFEPEPEPQPSTTTEIPDQFLPFRPSESDINKAKKKQKALEDTLGSTSGSMSGTGKLKSTGFPSSYQLQFDIPKGGAAVDRRHFMIRDSVTDFRELQLRQQGLNRKGAAKE
mmetsp:Transcript_7467/g.19283  ORF Transcript_7467/g.19283 Transcript_7467/m.19283 type:complete len:162 (-) Transcript_7467:713-1198(-)|eukprot:CAMPEP_0113900408 /NCGR_PEP_ID=MMETSP0780_2-20120614/20656_1 /TAXON_ID=652834 /ORGANISM="Palpitomonas bilix" /LENGTH=161 /DNA_ID=CAMNT_0000892855 /DNA_START=173 /DNA_END=658 /DNA_ORIENTATION=- /assembly_acc=CAM_ASM_000599